jgi:hypothetical protein
MEHKYSTLGAAVAKRLSMARSRTLRSGACAQRLAALLCVLLLVAQAEKAQSGRAPKQDIPPPQVSSENLPKPNNPKTTQAIPSLMIVNSVSSASAPVWTSLAMKELIDRIRESPKVNVTREKDMSRKAAGELAQKKTDAYVLWIEFEVDASMAVIDRDAEATIVTGLNPGCLFISYVMFEPGTTNIKAQERVYQDGYRGQCTGTAIQPAPQSSDRQRYPVTRTLPKAAREAADRIMNALDIRVPIARIKQNT